MNKVLAIVLVLLVIGAVSLTMLSPKESPGVVKGYSEFLPSHTIMLFAANSPLQSSKKIEFNKYPDLFNIIKGKMQFDFTNQKFYHEKGFDFSKPLGFAIASLENMSMVFFCGVKNESAFSDFLNEMIFVGSKIQPADVSGVPCFLVQKPFSSQPSAVYCYKDGYFILYALENRDAQKNLLVNFEKEILQSSDRLSQNIAFQDAVKGIKDLGDIFQYMDYPRLTQFYMDILSRFQPGQSDKLQPFEKMADDIISMAFSLKLSGKEFQIHSYMGFKPNSELLKAYQSKGTTEDILQQLPPNPLVCFASCTDMQKSWEIVKPALDMMLSLSPLGQQWGNSLNVVFEKAEKVIKQDLGLTVSIEKDILLNIQGSNALVLYNLPSPEKKNFDFLFAMKLNNASKMQNLLSDILQGVQKENIDLPLKQLDGKDIQGMSFSLSKWNPELTMEPALCVWQNYLLFLSQKEILNNMKGGLLESLSSQKVREGLKKGSPSAGCIKLNQLIIQLLNLMPQEIQKDREAIEMFTKHFQDFLWTVELIDNGMYAMMSLNSDGDFLGQIFEEASKLIQMQQNPK